VRLVVIGDTAALPPALGAALAAACAATQRGTALRLAVAVNYSGRCARLRLQPACLNLSARAR
jgi:undecaprenyl pyrophosphate synthase